MLYLTVNGKVVDTKKIYLDTFFKTNKDKTERSFAKSTSLVKQALDAMYNTFTTGDKLLRSPGMVILYYLLFEKALVKKWAKTPPRSVLADFEAQREENRQTAAMDITKADYDLLEFDRLTQTPNDAYAIGLRLDLLEKFVTKQKPPTVGRLARRK
jgi:hypothetical protein